MGLRTAIPRLPAIHSGRPLLRDSENYLAIFWGFCDKFGSSESRYDSDIVLSILRFEVFPARAGSCSARKPAVILTLEQDLWTRPALGAAPCLVFQGGACWSL